MAQYEKRYKLANPGKKRKVSTKNTRNRVRFTNPKRLTLKQKLHFGSKRQRAAAKVALSGHRRRSNLGKKKKGLTVSSMKALAFGGSYQRKQAAKQRRFMKYGPKPKPKRESNIGEILTYRFPNPSNRKRRKVTNMAKSHRRRRRATNPSTRRRRVYRRRTNPTPFARAHRRRRRNSPKVVVRYRNPNRRRHYSRRRNPGGVTGMFGGRVGKVLGVLGGATVTKLISDRLPLGLNTGFMGYISTAVVAILQGKLVGKVAKSPALGDDMVIGGFTYLAIKVINDLFPSFGTALPFGLKGMGLLGRSNFYVPQVNKRGSMGQFLVPPGIPAPVMVAAGGMHGITGNAQGGGRMGLRRMGRVS